MPTGQSAFETRTSFSLIFLSCLCLLSAKAICATVHTGLDCLAMDDEELPESAGPRSVLVLPSSACPSVINWGETFEIILRQPEGFSDLGSPHDWGVCLSTRAVDPWGVMIGLPVGLRFTLKIERVEKGPCDHTISLTVNAGYKTPRDTYHLQVMGPSGLHATSIYSVRLLGAKTEGKLRVAVIADHQLKDPSVKLGGGDLNNGSYPHLGETSAESIMLQETRELSFFDPDLVLHLGDLVFGTDYRTQIPSTLHLWWQKPLGTLMVPGNHDGMALYRLSLKQDWYKGALHSIGCANKVLAKDVDIDDVFCLLACIYGDLKKMLFENLDIDGLKSWKKYLGPENFSVSVDGTRFIGLNSYSGSAERRHGFAFRFDAFGLDVNFGTAVDNYGGFIRPDVLEWLNREFLSAKKNSEKVVLFLHHDPRGNQDSPWGMAYHPNLPFPTEPLGLRKFQEWNFEGDANWDSDPYDGIAGETQKSNSAVHLLKLIASSADLVLMGHAHVDRDKVYKAGDELVAGSGIRAGHRIRFTRVTTASAHPGDPDAYWGYRLAEISPKTANGLSWRPEKGQASVPAGNLWIVGQDLRAEKLSPGLSGGFLYVVHNGLPQKVTGVLRAYLDAHVQGWSFKASGDLGTVRLLDVGIGEAGSNIYYLGVDVPACRGNEFPPQVGAESVLRIEAHRDMHNRVPVAGFSMSETSPGANKELVFDASDTTEPDGNPIISYKWSFGDGYDQRGKKVVHSFGQAGNYKVRMTATDSHGAYSSYTQTVRVTPSQSCSSSTGSPPIGILFVLLLFAIYRHRAKSR